jgi:hypothetical protein
MRLRLLASLVIVVAWCLAGCGPTPPQAPFDQAKELDRGTSGISTACGEAAQVTEFPGDHERDLQTLEATAASSARRLVSVYHRNPAWIYQGETVRAIVSDGLSMLRSCGLRSAADVLAAAR